MQSSAKINPDLKKNIEKDLTALFSKVSPGNQVSRQNAIQSVCNLLRRNMSLDEFMFSVFSTYDRFAKRHY
jgi:hypothetical protein